jgi:hypothetical protein
VEFLIKWICGFERKDKRAYKPASVIKLLFCYKFYKQLLFVTVFVVAVFAVQFFAPLLAFLTVTLT